MVTITSKRRNAPRPKAVFLVESPLGLGNIKMIETTIQSLQARGVETVVITGLSDDKLKMVHLGDARVHHLPNIRFDEVLNTVVTADGKPLAEDQAYQQARADQTMEILKQENPDSLVFQFYPVGRAYLEPEYLQILQAAKKLPKPPVVTSLMRDIYFENSRNQRIPSPVDTVRKHFDGGCIVFSDPKFIKLEESWHGAAELGPHMHYAGFSAAHPPKRNSNIPDKDREVIITGGGQLTDETFNILKSTLQARPQTKYANHTWRVLVPKRALESPQLQELREIAAKSPQGKVIFEANRDDLIELMSNAALVISQAGYNQALELLQTATPTVLVPRVASIEDDVMEQFYRAYKANRVFAPQIQLLTPQHLQYPALVASTINQAQLGNPNKKLSFMGGETAAEIIQGQIKDRVGTPSTLAKTASLGIDIGGTNVKWEAYELNGGNVGKVLASGSLPTHPAAKDLVADVTKIVADATAQCAGLKARLETVGVAFPGKLDSKGNVRQGSAPNLGEPLGKEFDDRNVYELFAHSIPAGVTVNFLNDAVAQHQALIQQELKKPKGIARMGGKTVGYLAAGTGLGGGFATVSTKGAVTPITDGHVHDMMITLPAKDMAFLEEANAKLPAGVPPMIIRNGQVMAGDVLSGKGMERIIGPISNQTDIARAPLYEAYTDIAARAMAEVIGNIRHQQVSKERSDQDWTAEDKALAAQTSIYFISGGMGTSPTGLHILEKTKPLLKAKSLPSDFIISNANLGMQGACYGALAAAQRSKQ